MKTRSLSIWLLLASLMFSGFLHAAVELNEDVPETYIVKKGDTLWKIANSFAVSVDKIKQLNNMNSNVINIGQQLILNN